MKTITSENVTLTAQLLKHERRAQDQQRRTTMAKSLLVALVADGKPQDYLLRAFCAEALELRGADMDGGVASHAAGNRLDLGAGGLEPLVGCYPMTPYEYRLQTELVQTIDGMSSVPRHELAQRFGHLILPLPESGAPTADASAATLQSA